MGLKDLFKGTGGTRAVQGMPPKGVRLPGVGNGYTGSKVKVKLDKQAKPKGKHRS